MSNKPLDKQGQVGGLYTYSLSGDWEAFNKAMGISILTGEACSLSMRLLCELSEDALRLFLEYTGLRVDTSVIPHSQYNNREAYSMFLDHGMIESLIVFYLCHNFNHIQVVTVKAGSGFSGGTMFLCADDPQIIRNHMSGEHEYLYDHYTQVGDGEYKIVEGAIYSVGRSYQSNYNSPRVGFSNVHGFSGLYQ